VDCITAERAILWTNEGNELAVWSNTQAEPSRGRSIHWDTHKTQQQ